MDSKTNVPLADLQAMDKEADNIETLVHGLPLYNKAMAKDLLKVVNEAR